MPITIVENPVIKVSCTFDMRQTWVEAESLRHVSAKYCPLVPPQRSTIAAAFSLDRKLLASTHGDHTVKIIDCQTGSCLKVLSGHRRTPLVVRFHPLHPEILATGSLDHEVRLWDASTTECIGSRDFYRTIASIAFHAQGEVLAVASGHKVNDLDSPDSPMALATSAGYPLYPPPAVFFSNVHSGIQSNLETNVSPVPAPFLFWPTLARDEGRTSNRYVNRDVESDASLQPQMDAALGSQLDYLLSPMEISPLVPSSSHPVQDDTTYDSTTNETENAMSESTIDSTIDMKTTEEQPITSPILDTSYGLNNTPPVNLQSGGVGRTPPRHSRPGVEVTSSIYLLILFGSTSLQMLIRSGDYGQIHQFFPFGDPMFWEISFLQGWLMGQSQTGLNPMLSLNDALHESSSGFCTLRSDNILVFDMGARNVDVSIDSSLMAIGISQSRLPVRSGIRHRSSRSRSIASAIFGDGGGFINIATSLAAAAAAAAELPCTVKLRILPHDTKDMCFLLDAERCRLTIPHVVLCSEIWAHFSPCGRFLAACVACMLPHVEADSGLHMQHDVTGASTSTTRHPILALQVIYELRVYSLEKATFGSVLASRVIRAAHCLTSIQVYRVSDMELVRVLPSAEDEEGKLGILQYDSSYSTNSSGHNFFLEDNMLQCGRIGSTAADVTPIIHTSSAMPEVAISPASD
ncbi:hypothetical protein GIB67_019274 [Kingdonia uniflora]|uniref:Uncharacterized protein n=1 Tax=Kingdonia uniflora TaxID=39325 RepID=A0A7J7MZZ3_9MAGN|nr:hypothetical protein GIB67_019274 [Kingdonia uniflora]